MVAQFIIFPDQLIAVRDEDEFTIFKWIYYLNPFSILMLLFLYPMVYDAPPMGFCT